MRDGKNEPLKKALALLLLMLMLIPAAACKAVDSMAETLTLGALPSIDVLPFVIAEQQGYFKKHGVNVKLELFQSAKDRDAAFQAGALDGFCCDEVAVCIYRNAGTDLKITGMTDGEYVLVAGKAPGIASVSGMKGKSVAISENTLIEYVLDKILEKDGLTPADVVKTAVPSVPARLELLNAGKADAALLPEPYAALAVNDGGTALASATGIGLYPSVVAFTRQTIDGRRRDIAAMVAAYDDAVDYLNSTSITDDEDLIIKTVGYPESMKGSIKLPTFTKNRLPPAADLHAAIAWASAKGLCKDSLDPKDMVEDVH